MPKAAVCPAIDESLEVVDVELDDPKAGEVRVRMGASGVCHSDLSVVNGTLLSPLPAVLGHEGAGVVDAVGEGVDPGEARRPRRALLRPAVRHLLHVHARLARDVRDRLPRDGDGRAARHDAALHPRRRAAAPDVGARHLQRGARLPRDQHGQDRRRRSVHERGAHRLRCAHRLRRGREHRRHRAGRHRRRHRLRRRRPQRDPGREVEGRGADHRRRPLRLEARHGEAVRRDRSRQREQRRPGRAGAGAHRRARRRRVVRGDRAQGHRAAGVRDGAPRRSGDHRRRSEDGTDHGDPDRDGAARQREAGPGLVVRVLRRAARRAPPRRRSTRTARSSSTSSSRAGSGSTASTTRSRRWKRARSPDRSSTTASEASLRRACVNAVWVTAISSSPRSGSARGRSSPTGGVAPTTRTT